MRDWEHRLLERGEAAVRKHLDFYYPSHTETLLALITEGWRPPPPEDAVERASEYIERATAGLPVIKPLSGEYVSIPVPPSPELIEKALGEWNQHEMTTHSRAGRPGFVVNERACSCGAPLPWRDFEAHFDAHRLGAALRALGEA